MLFEFEKLLTLLIPSERSTLYGDIYINTLSIKPPAYLHPN